MSQNNSLFQYAKERLLMFGEKECSISELMMLLAGVEVDASLCMELGHLRTAEILAFTPKLLEERGFSEESSLRLYAAITLYKKIQRTHLTYEKKIYSPRDVYEAVEYLKDYEQKTLVVLALNKHKTIIGRKEVHIGTLHEVDVDVRDIFRYAISVGASCIIVAHQYQEYTTVSPSDLKTAKTIEKLGKSLGVTLEDHIIVCNDRFISLREQHHITCKR